MEIIDILKHALMITAFVFAMMLLIDFIDTASKRRMSEIIQGGQWRQYTLASFLGSTPGCLGAFMNVSLYVHGIISFGAITGGMIATSGDEAFVMLAEFPGTALLLFVLLFLMGIFFAWLSDKIVGVMGIVPCESCFEHQCKASLSGNKDLITISAAFKPGNVIKNIHSLSFTRFLLVVFIGSFLVLILLGTVGPDSWGWKRITFVCLSVCSLYIVAVSSEHYLNVHIWEHIIKNHLLRVFLWTFGALLFVHWALAVWSLDSFIREHMIWVLVIGALIGIIPESGPHLIFVMMYSQGLIPFSVLLTASFVQDGHGMLPLLSYSLKDSILIKIFNLVFGITIGAILFFLGF